MKSKITFIGDFAYFEGRMYSAEDIRMLADMRRKGFRDGKLEGDALEAFVVACLRTPDYRVLGLPMSTAALLAVRQHQATPVPALSSA